MVDRRVLGAFVCIDAITGASVVPAVPVSAAPWTVRANRGGTYVIFDGPQFSGLTDEFIPGSDWPATPSTFEVTLQDPSRQYLPRRAKVQAPLAVPTIPPVPPAPTGVFVAQQITLYPTPAAAIGPNWSIIHASVTQSGSNPTKGLPWAIVQAVKTSDNSVLATGQTDTNGEGLLAVIGLTVQPNTSGGGPVTVSSVAATVTVYFDPTVLTQPASWIANPDDILTKLANPALVSSSHSVQLSSGQELSVSFALTV